MLKKVLCISLLASASWWAHAADFTLTSASIEPEGTLTHDQVFDGFGCTGKNISPSLAWKNPPKGTKSYAITVYDPDAPTGQVGGTGSSTTFPHQRLSYLQVPAHKMVKVYQTVRVKAVPILV